MLPPAIVAWRAPEAVYFHALRAQHARGWRRLAWLAGATLIRLAGKVKP